MKSNETPAGAIRATPDDIRYAYRLLLGRDPDEAGFSQHVAHVRSNNLLATDLALGFMRSDEFLARNTQPPGLQEVVLHGTKVFPWRGDALIGDHVASSESYEPHILPVFLESLRIGDHVLDIGANIGIYSLLAAARVGSQGMVYSIEPVAKNVQSLCAGILGNGLHNVSVLPVAASDRCSVIGLLRFEDSSNGIVDSNSNVASASDFVPTQRVDHLLAGIRRLDVIKIDIEGHEPIAWEGLKSLVHSHRPLIFTEFSPVAIRNHARVDAKGYLGELFAYARNGIDVVHQEGHRVSCSNPDAVMNEWRAANERRGLDGALHLDLIVDARDV
jgi:FkbM family methyltransferase